MADDAIYLNFQFGDNVTGSITGTNVTTILQQYDALAARFGDSDESDTSDDKSDKPKRKRRTKAEIEADKKATEEAEKQEQAEAAGATDPEVTEADVRAASEPLIKIGQAGAEAAIKIVEDMGAVDETGTAKIAKMKPDQYAEAIQRFTDKAAEFKKTQAQGVL